MVTLPALFIFIGCVPQYPINQTQMQTLYSPPTLPFFSVHTNTEYTRKKKIHIKYLVSKSAQKMAVGWNKAFRHTLGIPYTTHTALLPGITGSKPFKEQHTSRVFKFISSFLSSNNEHVLLIGECAQFCVVGTLGRNWARRAMAVIAAPPCADSLASTDTGITRYTWWCQLDARFLKWWNHLVDWLYVL